MERNQKESKTTVITIKSNVSKNKSNFSRKMNALETQLGNEIGSFSYIISLNFRIVL